MATTPKVINQGTVVSSSTSSSSSGTPTTGIITTTTTTTTKQSTFDNGVIDISIIPFMRPISIDFVAEGLRPQRKVWFFFDDVDVTDYIIKTDLLELNANANVAVFTQGVSNNDTVTTTFGANTTSRGTVRVRRRHFADDDDGSSKNRRRILEISNTFGQFVTSQTVSGSQSGNTAAILSHVIRGIHRLGTKGGTGFANTSANSITLPISSRWHANNYWGTSGSNNVIIIPNEGRGAGKNRQRRARANIVSFNNVTGQLVLTQSFASLFPDEATVLDANNFSITFAASSNNGSDFYVSREGTVSGTFVVPPGMFRTGERIFRIIDVPTNDVEYCTTRAEYKFDSSGLQEVKNKIVLQDTKSTTTTVVTPPITPPRPVRDPQRKAGGGDRSSSKGDPIAQTFFVSKDDYPNGIFLSKVEIWFRTKDEIAPVTLEVRPVVNGYPSSYEVLEGGYATVKAEDIIAYENSPYVTDTITPYTGTYFKFDSPLYLTPGEYAIVLQTPSQNYEVWLSELGENIIGTNRKVSEQPYLGSFFKSQNASTWDASQLEDLMFRIYKCRFNTSGTVILNNVAPTANIPADMIYTHADDLIVTNTAISYTHSVDSGSTYETYVPDTNYIPTARKTIDNLADGKYKLKATLTTGDANVSPILYTKSFNLIAIENIINNANISNADITITNEGYGFANNQNVALTISGGGATTTAVGYAIAGTSNGGANAGISYVIVTDGGAGYSNTATVTALGGSNTQTFVLASEINPSGGPAICKYISKKVTLKEGFDAGDLRVWLTAYKPIGTDIKVYYKVRNSLDPVPFEKLPYVQMAQQTSSTVKSLNEYDTLEYEYRPVTANAVTYTSGTNTYKTFNQFAIKVVMSSETTVKYPVGYDLRAIALPGL